MALFKSGNPALSSDKFEQVGNAAQGRGDTMTLKGTVDKTAILLLVLIIPALYTWNVFTETPDFSALKPYFYTGLAGGLVIALIMTFKASLAPVLAPVYAFLQGLFLGGISAFMNNIFPGIVLQAIILTVGICALLLVIYKLEIIKATENFKLIVTSATGVLALYYIASFGLSFVGIQLPLIHENSMWGIIFSLFVVVIAAMNLVVDFDFIEKGAKNGAPKYMEWYGAFGLMVTIIWLYIELLRLLSKIRK